jgi:alanine-glyoxylate transaminase/serine-glyoxylate transaminase/serine-pyruvate transaminase
VDQIRADFGTTVNLAEVEKALSSKKYKLVTITHVDTSTGEFALCECYLTPAHAKFIAVLTHPKPIADLVQKHSPETLVILDAVCAVASEDIHMEEWGLDVVLSASQKGIGAPPGLSVLVASQKALATFNARTSPVPAYYVSWKRSVPVLPRRRVVLSDESPAGFRSCKHTRRAHQRISRRRP